MRPLIRLLTVLLAAATLFACSTSYRSSNRPSAPVTINGHCEQRETDGYSDAIKLMVSNNVVNALDWTTQPDNRSCRFELKNFTQTSTQPVADLQSKTDRNCHIYVWRDNNHITVATNNCQSLCAANDKILPVLLNPSTGDCMDKRK